MGRPTKYTPELVEKAEAYVTAYDSHGDAIPSISGLSRVIGVSRETIHTWAKDPEKGEFSDTLKDLSEEQQRVLLNKGLTGDFNSAITKLALHNHGYSERVVNTNIETTHEEWLSELDDE